MARYSMDKKELRKDVVRDKMLRLVELGYQHRKWVISAAGALVAGVLLIFALSWYSQYATTQQAAKFYDAERIMNDTRLSEQTRRVEARKSIQEFLEMYPDSQFSPVAYMFLAQIQWSEENLEEALAALAKAEQHGKSDEFTRQLARIGQAKLHESSGNLEASAKLYGALPEKPYADLKAYNLGRLATAGKKPEEARKQFEKVLNQFPPSSLAQWAEQAKSALP